MPNTLKRNISRKLDIKPLKRVRKPKRAMRKKIPKGIVRPRRTRNLA